MFVSVLMSWTVAVALPLFVPAFSQPIRAIPHCLACLN